MSDWSVRQLIDEYRSEGQENTAPKSRANPDYTDALQGVLAAMLMDEPSPPLSTQRPRGGVARTTEEALGALLNSNFGSDFSPSSATSSLPLNSSSRPSSVDTGSRLVGHKKPITTDEVISYLVGDLDSSAKSSVRRPPSDRSRFDPSAPSSDTKNNSVLAAANRLFDQSRYSLAADWKLGAPPDSPPGQLSLTASPPRRDSESNLDRAHFTLLPPALDSKPLTPLGQKDKIKASTPPEPVQTRSLVERKKSKENTENEAPGKTENNPPDQPHDDLVRPPAVRVLRAKPAKKSIKERVVKAKRTAAALPQAEQSKLSAPQEERDGFVISKSDPAAKTLESEDAPEAITSSIIEVPENPHPAVEEFDEPSLVDDSSESIEESESAVSNDKRVIPSEKIFRRKSAEAEPKLDQQKKRNPESLTLKKVKKKPPKKTDKVSLPNSLPNPPLNPPPKPIEIEGVASDGISLEEPEAVRVSEIAPSKSSHLTMPNEADFDSQDSEARHAGNAFRKLQTIAAQVVQKPASPAAWITPRPAVAQIESRFEAPVEAPINQLQLPSVQVELSAGSSSVDEANEEPALDIDPPSSIVPYVADHDENRSEANDDVFTAEPISAVENSEGATSSVDPPGGNEAEVEDRPAKETKRRSLPKRSAGRKSGALELVPANLDTSSTQVVPARRGQQTYGIQVSHARSAAPKRKPVQIEAMQPGKLRRISICDESTAVAGKIVRTASKRLRVPALKWWAGERIEYKSEDGTLGRTIATAIYRKEEDTLSAGNQKTRLRRLKEPLAITATATEPPQADAQSLAVVAENSDISKCKLHIALSNAADDTEWNTMKPRAVPALGVNRKNVVIRRSDVPNGWDLYKKNDMCFSANVLLQNACFASVLIRLPPSETNGVDMSKDTHMLVEFVSGATLLVLMSRESASSVEQGEIVGDRKGVELSRAGSKVMIPPMYRYQFKNVSETEESLLITHVVTENKSFFSK